MAAEKGGGGARMMIARIPWRLAFTCRIQQDCHAACHSVGGRADVRDHKKTARQDT